MIEDLGKPKFVPCEPKNFKGKASKNKFSNRKHISKKTKMKHRRKAK